MNNQIVYDDFVQTIIGRICETIQPKEIILFGSRANGSAKPDSDLDLLILYEGSLSKRDVKVAIRRLFPHPDFSMDLFVLSPAEFDRQKNVISSLGYTASREGIAVDG